jgi:Ca2+-binding RTX toxin-like protein
MSSQTLSQGRRRFLGSFRRRGLSAVAAAAVVIGTASGALGAHPASAGPVGNGMNITAGDIDFVLKQILISERHSWAYNKDVASVIAGSPRQNSNPATDPFFCLSMVGSASDQIPDALSSYGLRTVDGSCNNITDVLDSNTSRTGSEAPTFVNHPSFGAADQPFPRLTTPVFREAEGRPANFFGPGDPGSASSSYTQKLNGNIVYDTQPRTISNLIVDQTSTNPAAVAAAGHPQRSQSSAPTAVPCTTDPDPTAVPPVDAAPAGCTPSHKTLFIPNITTDTGLSPPFNSLFTFFGQFFDHGVDQTVKSSGTVFVPLKADDPLRTVGPDGIAGTNCGTPTAKNCDEVPASQAFMALTRAQNQPGPDGVIGTADDIQDANNTDSPWVDLSQDYASHASHQVFLRDYQLDASNHPVNTGRFLSHSDGGMPTWADVKTMAATKLGLLLQDKDVLAVPTLAVDPYGNLVPGPHGLAQYVTASGLLEGNLANPVAVPSNVLHFDTPFLTDVAHNADPSPQDTDHNPGTPPVDPTPDVDTVANHDFAAQALGTYDDELLDSHAICGDGRCNENIALTTIHGIFHAEHNRLVGDAANCPVGTPNPTILCILNDPANSALLAKFNAAHPAPDGSNSDISYGFGGRLFQVARFFTEMQYQHLVFEEFARKVQPAVRAFHVYSPDINSATKAEFAHAVYRFGHSMLDDTIARSGSGFESTQLLDGFLNPPELRTSAACPNVCAQNTDADHGMAAIIMGSSDQTGNEIDEFVVETLRNNLLGLPLDLPVLNMARARSEGVPPLNQFRRDLLNQTNDSQLAPYTSWADYGQHLKHPESLVNFVAAYGTHPTIQAATTLASKRAAARAIVDPQPGDHQPPDAEAFMFSTSYPGADAVPAVPAVPAVQAVQPFVWSPGSTPADFTLTFGASVTPTIPVGDPISSIDAALDAIVPGGVTVTGGPTAADGFTVTFDVAAPVPAITTSNVDLTLDTANQVAGQTAVPGTPAVPAIPAKDWSNDANGVTTTGLDSVDLWVGGLAELTNQNGGMLGSTFNYVFQSQLENLQDGDRLYYLNRTPGMNFRTQLEGNSFAELIQRNIPGTSTLKADAFARADCKFELANISGPYNGSPTASQSATPPLAPLTGAASLNDDPNSGCDENQVLTRQPGGPIQYRATNNIDPSGINGQGVYNGTAGNDNVAGGVDNDTIWGGDGNDRIEGNNGDDFALGGNGDDIITDSNGADVPKGGPGNDAIDAGPGDDIPMGNAGQDFINAGQGDNETFAGEGNDFIIAGGGADAVFGDGGDDWIEGGTGQDLLQGDHGAPFFDDPAESKPGNDVFVGQPGENDYDAEGGDDVMSQNAAVDRNAGAGGFDWAFHQYDSTPANDDLMINNNLGGLPIQVIVNRDRWQETEADSGGPGVVNDVMKGADGVVGTPKFISGGGFTGCDAIDQSGLDRISGLTSVLPPIGTWTTDAAVVKGLSLKGDCPLTGPVWGDGDVLVGGPGSDTFTGRTGDDVIDGDKYLQVTISVRANADGTGPELGRTDLMENLAKSGSFGPNTTGQTLQSAIFAGKVNPGQLVAVREILTPTVTPADCGAAAAKNCDTAVFAGPASQYTITADPNVPGAIDVTDTTSTPAAPGAPATGDGTDILRNVEQAQFTDQTVSLVPAASVAPLSLTFGNQLVGTTSAAQGVTVTNTSIAPVTVTNLSITGTDATSFSATGCTAAVPAGGVCTVNVRFTPSSLTPVGKSANLVITSNASNSPQTVTLTGTAVNPQPPVAVTFPAAPTVLTTTGTVSFSSTAANPPITGFTAQLVAAGTTTPVLSTQLLGPNATSVSFSLLAPGNYQVILTATNAVGSTPATSAVFSIRTAPTVAPTNVVAAIAGVGSVTISWTGIANTVPANGNPATPGITYAVQRVNPVGGALIGAPIPVTGTSTTVLGLGNNTPVAFRVAAVNAVGTGPLSATATVTTATTPSAPATPTVTQGNGTLTVHWVAPANGGLPITSYTVTTFAANGTTVQRTDTGLTGTSFTVPGLAANTTHQFRVSATNAVNAGPQSALSGVFRVITVPTAPRTPTTTNGTAGGAVTFAATWTVPANTGGTGVAITGYTLTYFPVNAAGVQNGTATTVSLGNVTNRTITNGAATPLTANTRYRFTITARNVVGTGVSSAASAPAAGSIAR